MWFHIEVSSRSRSSSAAVKTHNTTGTSPVCSLHQDFVQKHRIGTCVKYHSRRSEQEVPWSNPYTSLFPNWGSWWLNSKYSMRLSLGKLKMFCWLPRARHSERSSSIRTNSRKQKR